MTMDRQRACHGIIAVLAVGVFAALFGSTTVLARAHADTPKPSQTMNAENKSGQRSGEEVFMQNCSRCHKPPMSISPRITGTVLIHMRVRAKLSKQDEQALLRYLAP